MEIAGLKPLLQFMRLYGKLLEIKKKNFQYKKILIASTEQNKMEVAMEVGLLMLSVMLKRTVLFLLQMILMKENIIVVTHVKRMLIINKIKNLLQDQNN